MNQKKGLPGPDLNKWNWLKQQYIVLLNYESQIYTISS